MDLFNQDLRSSDARFNEDGTRRYMLCRVWEAEKGLVMWVGLNPSIADESEPDPTIRRVTRFTRDWGYGGFYMVNLFSLVSTDPKGLRAVTTEVDPANQGWIDQIGPECSRVVFCWGNIPIKLGREQISRLEKH